MKFVLFHGAFGSPDGNWYPELKSKLKSLGQIVYAPPFPQEIEKELTDKGPGTKIERLTLTNWLEALKPFLKEVKKNEKVCFVGHSLGCVFILHAVLNFNIRLDCAIFVGPFLACLPTEIWPYSSIIKDFGKTDFDFDQLKKLIPVSYVLYSDNDPYVPIRQAKLFGKALDSSMIMLKGAGHMNTEVNLDEFALVLDLCLTRLNLTYAQKYRFLNRKIGAYEYIYLNKEGGIITLDAKSSIEEGIFDFRDVQRDGFATQFTGFDDIYGNNSNYMLTSRKAARRMDKFIRVILVEKLLDLNKTKWQEQIKKDGESGIEIYLCLYDQVKTKIPEPDFGIWDSNHVVIGQFDRKTRKATKVIVDSTLKGLKTALDWKKEIMKYSYKINKLSDIRKFIDTHSS